MTREHAIYFEGTLGYTEILIKRVLDHLTRTNQAWCFVDGQILDRGFCERFLQEIQS